jgi:hypothetical protein
MWVEVQFHAFLVLALAEESGQLHVRPFYLQRKILSNHWAGDSIASSFGHDVLKIRKNLLTLAGI